MCWTEDELKYLILALNLAWSFNKTIWKKKIFRYKNKVKILFGNNYTDHILRNRWQQIVDISDSTIVSYNWIKNTVQNYKENCVSWRNESK